MSEMINSPCKNPMATLFIMSDDQRKLKKVFVDAESRTHVVVSGKVPVDPGVALIVQIPQSSPFCMPLSVTRRRVTGGYGGKQRVGDHFCWWAIFKCDDVWVRGRHFWRADWESWSHFRDRHYFGPGWTTAMLVFKLPQNLYFF